MIFSIHIQLVLTKSEGLLLYYVFIKYYSAVYPDLIILVARTQEFLRIALQARTQGGAGPEHQQGNTRRDDRKEAGGQQPSPGEGEERGEDPLPMPIGGVESKYRC